MRNIKKIDIKKIDIKKIGIKKIGIKKIGIVLAMLGIVATASIVAMAASVTSGSGGSGGGGSAGFKIPADYQVIDVSNSQYILDDSRPAETEKVFIPTVVNVYNPTGTPLAKKKVYVDYYVDGEFYVTQSGLTDSNGVARFLFVNPSVLNGVPVAHTDIYEYVHSVDAKGNNMGRVMTSSLVNVPTFAD